MTTPSSAPALPSPLQGFAEKFTEGGGGAGGNRQTDARAASPAAGDDLPDDSAFLGDEEGDAMDKEGGAAGAAAIAAAVPKRPAPPSNKAQPRRKKKAAGVLGVDAIARACAPTGLEEEEEENEAGQELEPDAELELEPELEQQGSDTEGQIDYLLACEVTSTRLQFHVMWDGYPHLRNWWQRVDEAIAVDTLAQPEPYLRKVLELEAELEIQPSDAGQKTQCLIVEVRADAVWALHAADGTELTLDAARCRLINDGSDGSDGSAQERMVVASWRLLLDQQASLTDHALDWSSDTLKEIRDEWDSTAFPTPAQAQAIVLEVGEQAVYTEEGDSLEAVGELCTWLKSPSKTYMLARIPAETLLADWMHGSLVRDALQTLSGIDARDVRTMVKPAK